MGKQFAMDDILYKVVVECDVNDEIACSVPLYESRDVSMAEWFVRLLRSGDWKFPLPGHILDNKDCTAIDACIERWDQFGDFDEVSRTPLHIK